MSQVGRNACFLLSFLCIGYGLAASNIYTAVDYVAVQYSLDNSVRSPRSLIRVDSGDILVISQETSQIIAIYQDEYNRVKTALIVGGISGLNHGLAYKDGYLYASTSNEVLRWGYNPWERTQISTIPEVVVRGIPADGQYVTRSIIVDPYKTLYVSVGASKNVDDSKTRAQIRRFNLAEAIPENGYKYEDGEIFAAGVRNAVGLAIDQNNKLWGADCGADDLERADLGPNIHNTNPADELIRFEKSNVSYGYPYCWTVDELKGQTKGKQYAWPDFMEDKVHTDAWCRDFRNNQPPNFVLPAHNAPLGLVFYDGVGCGTLSDSFPCSMKNDLFIAFHGSTNRQPPSGYKVIRMPFDNKTGSLTGEMEDVVFQADSNACAADPNFCFRPVGLVFSQNGHLFISSDSTNELIRIGHENKFKLVVIIKNSLHVPGVIALAVIAIITTCLVIMLVRRYCCRRTEEVPYVKENI